MAGCFFLKVLKYINLADSTYYPYCVGTFLGAGDVVTCSKPDCCFLFPQLRDVLPGSIYLHKVSVFEVSGYDMSPRLWHWN